MAAALRAEGVACDVAVVSSQPAFEQALAGQSFDVILADDWLPSFDGMAALAIAQRLAPMVPFICVSGTMGEEIAVERLKAGATDYVLKQRLRRLPAAIFRAIPEAAVRAERGRAELEIRRLNADLERRVLERTTQLAAANAALAERGLALRRSEERLQAILDHSPTGIFLKDLDGRYQFVNRHFERDFGVDRRTMIGRTDRELFAPRLAEIYREHDARALEAGAVVEIEEAALHGQTVRLHASSRFPLVDPDGQAYAVCGISVDVTDRKLAEDELKAARLEAERANRAKNEFLSRMSHDLRTPLNAVLGFAQLLAADRLTPSQAECVEQISRGGNHLLDRINEVLDLARIESGRLAIAAEAISVRDAVASAVDLVAPLAGHRGIAVRVEDGDAADGTVLADPQRLSQILLNLLSNAVKYNQPDGEVVVRLDAPAPGVARIAVSDTGPGIAPDKIPLLFRPFERLGAESRLGTGSRFRVDLPTTVPAPRTGRAAAVPLSLVPAEATGPGTVLYIEDQPSNVRLIERLLSTRPGLTLLHAADGGRGLAVARARRPDLVLLDLHLPDQPGERVLRQIRADADLRATPVVVLSADATAGMLSRLREAGAS